MTLQREAGRRSSCRALRALARVRGTAVVAFLLATGGSSIHAISSKLDPQLSAAAFRPIGYTQVVVAADDGAPLDAVALLIVQLGGTVTRPLPIINALAATVPNPSVPALADSNLVRHVSLDRLIVGALERTGATVGATAVREELGLDGSGVGIAVIDSGVSAGLDDLGDQLLSGAQRIDRFVDFVDGREQPYDDYGHGTHVAGVIAGDGYDSSGARSGIAPGARLVILKALDRWGQGRISNVIAALDYAVVHRSELNIRIVNLSVGAGVYESYQADPLTIAAKRAVQAGLVVVAAAGNAGRDAHGRTQYGGITAPGNAPWVLTVGASSHMGTADRGDDTMAAFSSRGPTAIDRAAKPDIVAPGVGIESLSAPDSVLYKTKPAYLLNGTVATPYLPYLSLSGTSMAAPVVAGTAALMLQANPSLSPNGVKAILQFTAQEYPGYDALTQGAGFLNARGAVELARVFAEKSATRLPATAGWSGHIIWGNRRVKGGWLTLDGTAWAQGVDWGEARASAGRDVVWGAICTERCNTSDAAVWAPWGRPDGEDPADVSTPHNGIVDDVVWGTTCGEDGCPRGTVWRTNEGDSVVWGSSDGDSVVWGSGCIDPSCDALWPKP